MKKCFFIVLLVCVTSIVVWANTRVQGDTLNVLETSEKFGAVSLDNKKFAQGDESIKAKMASSMLKKKKQFIGKTNYQIRDTLGDFTGHYISGLYPTYMIYTAKNGSESSWQIVFLIDANGLVKDIVVHKNCCYAQ